MEKINKKIEDLLEKIDKTPNKASNIEFAGKSNILTLSESGDYYYYGELFKEDEVLMFNDGDNVSLLKRIPKDKIRDSLKKDILLHNINKEVQNELAE